jgi:hypothetical protein
MNEVRLGFDYNKRNISVIIVTQKFRNSHGGDGKTFKMMTSTLPLGTLGSVASLLTVTLC